MQTTDNIEDQIDEAFEAWRGWTLAAQFAFSDMEDAEPHTTTWNGLLAAGQAADEKARSWRLRLDALLETEALQGSL